MFDFLSQRFSSIFSSLTGKSHLTEKNMAEAFEKVRESLLEADVPYQLIDTFIDDIKKEAVGQKVLSALKPGEQLIKLVHERLKLFLGGDQQAVEFNFQIPSTIMVMGLQGSGKTTSIGKIAHLVQEQAKKRGKQRRILLASVDFYRPAAIDQLEILAKTIGASFYRSTHQEAVKAAKEIQQYAKKESFELLFLDTAGRLHVDDLMLQELRDIDSQVAPKYKLLVLDSMTGQESLTVAQAFEQGVGYHMAMLTKVDSDTRGGAAFAFRYAQKKPIVYVGSGEKIGDIELFHPDRMAGRILGMGDVLSLIEKAESSVKQSEQDRLYKNMMDGRMNLQDFADQMTMVSKIGSLSQLSKYMPAIPGMKISQEDMEKGEREVKKFKAIISSMTMKERLYPKLLDASRKKRIAKGAGVAPADITILLDRFEQSQQFAKLFKKFGRGGYKQW